MERLAMISQIGGVLNSESSKALPNQLGESASSDHSRLDALLSQMGSESSTPNGKRSFDASQFGAADTFELDPNSLNSPGSEKSSKVNSFINQASRASVSPELMNAKLAQSELNHRLAGLENFSGNLPAGRQMIQKGNFEMGSIENSEENFYNGTQILDSSQRDDFNMTSLEDSLHWGQRELSGSHFSGTNLPNGTQVLSSGKEMQGFGGIGKSSKPRIEMSGGDYLSTLGVVQNPSLSSAQAKLNQDQLNSQDQQKGQSGLFGQANGLRAQSKDNQAKFGVDFAEAQKLGVLNAADNQYNPIDFSQSKLNVEMNAQVVPGAMAKPRLSTDTLIGMSSSVRNLSLQGGGSIRVRLKPENLGELSIRVITEGNKVGLHIQASNEKAKQILEENLGHLKESLAAQNLSLNQVEMSVGSNSLQSDSQNKDNQGQSTFQNFSNMNENMAQNPHQHSRNESFHQQMDHQQLGVEGDLELKRTPKAQSLRMASGIESERIARSGDTSRSRLDVRA